MCPLYIAGLIGPSDRNSVRPMAARTGENGYDQLHHFVAVSNRLVGSDDAFLVIDDMALPKKGRHSVGIAPTICVVAQQDREQPIAHICDTGIG